MLLIQASHHRTADGSIRADALGAAWLEAASEPTAEFRRYHHDICNEHCSRSRMVQSDNLSSSVPARGPELLGGGIYTMMLQTLNQQSQCNAARMTETIPGN